MKIKSIDIASFGKLKNYRLELSDGLNVIYGENEKRIDVEAVSAWMLAEDLIENQFLGLEEEGYQLSGSNRIDELSGNCMINTKYMQRVLNNILSNPNMHNKTNAHVINAPYPIHFHFNVLSFRINILQIH